MKAEIRLYFLSRHYVEALSLHQNCLLHNAQGRGMETYRFWYQSVQRYKIHSHGCCLHNASPKANDIPFCRWWHWIVTAPVCVAAQLTILQIINIAVLRNEVTSLTLHCIFLFPSYLIHIVWPSSCPHASFFFFSPLSWTGCTSKTHSANSLRNRAALLYTTAPRVHVPMHTVQCGFMHVCECQCDELNTNDGGGGGGGERSLLVRLWMWELSPASPLFITFSSFPFNLCRQGRHQSDWQLVWSSFRAWWEKERCQHKYPSWIGGGHGAAMATMNLHPLSQAEKKKPQAHQHDWKLCHSEETPAPHTLRSLSWTNNMINTVSLLLVLDCLPIFISTRADITGSRPCCPCRLANIYSLNLAQFANGDLAFFPLFSLNKLMVFSACWSSDSYSLISGRNPHPLHHLCLLLPISQAR